MQAVFWGINEKTSVICEHLRILPFHNQYGTCGSPWSLPAALLKWTICALVWQLSPGSNGPDQCAIRKRISILECCHSPTLFTCYQGATWQHHCNGGEWCGSKYRQPPRGPRPTWNPMYRAPMSHALSTMAMAHLFLPSPCCPCVLQVASGVQQKSNCMGVWVVLGIWWNPREKPKTHVGIGQTKPHIWY